MAAWCVHNHKISESPCPACIDEQAKKFVGAVFPDKPPVPEWVVALLRDWVGYDIDATHEHLAQEQAKHFLAAVLREALVRDPKMQGMRKLGPLLTWAAAQEGKR